MGTLTPAAPDPGISQAATWWLDPASLPIDPKATRLRGFVQELACASGRSPEGRILKPDVDYGADALTVTFSIAPLPGDQDCQGNEPFGVIFELVEPVGGRPILDGSTTPAKGRHRPAELTWQTPPVLMSFVGAASYRRMFRSVRTDTWRERRRRLARSVSMAPSRDRGDGREHDPGGLHGVGRRPRYETSAGAPSPRTVVRRWRGSDRHDADEALGDGLKAIGHPEGEAPEPLGR